MLLTQIRKNHGGASGAATDSGAGRQETWVGQCSIKCIQSVIPQGPAMQVHFISFMGSTNKQ
jgi:hypothetical protein